MNERQDRNELLSAEEAATKLKISKKTQLKWAREGKIGSVRLSAKMIRFSGEQLSEFIRRMTHEVEPEKTRRPTAMSPAPSPQLGLKQGKKQHRQLSWKELRAEMDAWDKEKK